MNELSERFRRDGFLLVPGVLSPDRVRDLRSFGGRLFADKPVPGDEGTVESDAFCRHPELWPLLVDPAVVSTLSSLLGDDYVYMHEWAFHDSAFGGWHKDTTSQEMAGLRFHYDEDFGQIQIAFYLQDNGMYGGGLDVIRGSHVDPQDPHINRSFFQKVRGRLRAKQLWPQDGNYVSIPSKAGDLVMFNFRTSHKATWPKAKPVPDEQRKFAIFFTASRAGRHASSFVRWIETERSPHLADHSRPGELVEFLGRHGRVLV